MVERFTKGTARDMGRFCHTLITPARGMSIWGPREYAVMFTGGVSLSACKPGPPRLRSPGSNQVYPRPALAGVLFMLYRA